MAAGVRRLTREARAAEDVAWIGAIAAAAVTFAAVRWLAPAVDGWLDPPGDYAAFPIGRSLSFAPEPLEEARFLIAIAVPFLLAAAVLWFGTRSQPNRRLDPAIIALQVAGLAFIAWAATQQNDDLLLFPHYVSAYNYLPEDIFGVPVLLGGALTGVALLTLLVARPDPIPAVRRLRDRRLAGLRWLPAVLAAAAAVLWLLPGIVTDGNVGRAGLSGAHVPLQFEDYLAVVNGRTPLVDYYPTYAGLLPLASAPVLAAFDSSVTAYSLIEVALSLAAVMCVYAALVNVTGRRWPALALFIPFLAISFLPWHLGPGATRVYNGLYYSAFPDRYLGVFVVIWLLARHLRRGSPGLWVVFFATGLTLLNNFDFGSCCLIATVAASACAVDRSAPIGLQLKGLLGQAVAGLAGAMVLVSAVTLIRSGELPDPAILTYWSRVIGRQGYGLLPMDTFGLHWALYAAYAGALLAAAVRLIRLEPERVLTPMLAFLGVFGLLSGQYFAGRSQGTQLMVLFPVWGLTLALLTWLVFSTWNGAQPARARRSIVPALAVLIGFGLMVASVARIPAPWRQVDRIATGGNHPLDLTGEQRFVEANTAPGEKVEILSTPLDHRVAERAGVDNVSPWGGSALFSEQEVNRTLEELEDADGNKIFANFSAMSPDSAQIEQILRTRGFRLVSTDPVSKLSLWVEPLRPID